MREPNNKDNQPVKTKPPKRKRRRSDANEFYEVIPFAASPHYVYRDDLADDTAPTAADSAKITAIITLVVVAVVAVGLALLFARGISTLKDASPAASNQSQSVTR